MINISFDETHHIKDGKPLYKGKYTRVMSFHNGIAPVEKDNVSFFINENNKQLFNKSFLKAYGFYENLAAVQDEDGWFHIDINGNDIYNKRYSWVGNFGEQRCVVRDFNNNYFHIDINGKRVYKQYYSYVGDFKYGIAVVMNEDGKSTHIDSEGKILHGNFFDELNVYHKGYAIAKDKRGYFHIDKMGCELYTGRYQKLEDFYNGCAFATTYENTKILLNEKELTRIELTKQRIDKDKILNESFGYFKYQILFAILKLDILYKIKHEEPIELPSVSLKLVYSWLIVEKIIDKNKRLTKLGEVYENELKDLILYWQDLPFKTSSYMVDTLTSGNEFFSKIFNVPYFEFLEDNNDCLALSLKMNSFYNTDYSNLIKYLNLTNEIVADIGGGNSSLMTMVEDYYPDIEAIVADKFLEIENKNNIKIDFLKEFTINANVFLLSRILHDWNDNDVLKILKNISLNMDETSILYIFETIVPEEITNDKGITLSFHLLNFLGGRERTFIELQNLLNKANLQVIEVFSKSSLISLIGVKRL